MDIICSPNVDICWIGTATGAFGVRGNVRAGHKGLFEKWRRASRPAVEGGILPPGKIVRQA